MSKKFVVLFSVVLIVIVVAVAIIMFPWNSSFQPKAAIVDNLALMPSAIYYHQNFVKNATKILRDVGLEVDYFPLDKVTVDLYRRLSSYSIVILRVHSGMLDDETYLFSSERLTSESIEKYSQYLQDKYLGNACIPSAGEYYIAVGPSFIRDFSESFHNSIIVAMGCDSLKTTALAEAFVKRGASVYIGWTHEVTPEGTDNATLKLLKRFFIKNMTVSEAVKGLKDNVTFAELDFYPPKAENLRPLTLIKKSISVKSSIFVDIYCLVSNEDDFERKLNL